MGETTWLGPNILEGRPGVPELRWKAEEIDVIHARTCRASTSDKLIVFDKITVSDSMHRDVLGLLFER